MSKRTKIASILLCVALMFSMCMFVVINGVNAQTNTEQVSSFKMVDGASIRTKEPAGIRFSASISKAEYDNLVATHGENLEFGMCIGRNTTVEDLKSNPQSMKKSLTWDINNNPETGTENYIYNLVIRDIAEVNFNAKYIAIGYIKAGVENQVTYSAFTEGMNERTPLQVALMYKADNPLEDMTFINSIIDKAVTNDNISFDKTDYNLIVGKDVVPVITVDGVKVVSELKVANTEIAIVENGKIVAKQAGTTTVTATIKGQSTEYTAQANIVVENDFVEITTAEELIDALNTTDAKAKFRLANSIDMSEYLALNPWTGYVVDTFVGTLDGNGYAITGLKRVGDESESGNSGVAFIGTIDETAVIKNVKFDIDFTSYVKYAGVVADYMFGKISDCYFNVIAKDLSGFECKDFSLFAEVAEGYGSDPSVRGEITNCVFNVDSSNTSDGSHKVSIAPLSNYGEAVIKNVFLISEKEPYLGYRSGTKSSGMNMKIENAYYYTTIEDFIKGVNGKKHILGTIDFEVVEDVIQHSILGSSWEIDETTNTIKLMGKTV